jgi:hypothetical protein
LTILERKIETKEGLPTYEKTNEIIFGTKKTIKQRELIDADNIK